MIYPNRYDSFFEKESNEDGNITLNLVDNLSIEVFPFETIDGEVLYEVSPMNSALSIYEIAELCKCKVVLAHIKSDTIWKGDIEIIKRTPQTIETLYEVSDYGAYWQCRSKYTVFSSVEEIKMFYLRKSRKILSEMDFILPNNLPFSSSQYLNKISDIIENKISNEWGNLSSLFSGHYDSNLQYVPNNKIELTKLATYRNKELHNLLFKLDKIESSFKLYSEEIKSAKYILIGTSDIKEENLELCPLSSDCLDEYDGFSYGETSHKCFLAMSPQ